MDLSQITSSTAQNVQGQGRHHHHKSISDQVSQMGSAIDNAVKAGTMTSDQASTLKQELADVTKTVGQTPTASANGQTGQTNPLSQLSDADRKKVFGELQDVRKQLYSAMNPQGASSSNASGPNSTLSITG
jgi:polyhydroxyalkanoate synthesis regulator phasin